jgi:hypothetical protein
MLQTADKKSLPATVCPKNYSGACDDAFALHEVSKTIL